jgi:hypothetical protein
MEQSPLCKALSRRHLARKVLSISLVVAPYCLCTKGVIANSTGKLLQASDPAAPPF